MKRHNKITKTGQACPNCSQAVERKTHPVSWCPKPGHIWFEWWFWCRWCRTTYLVEAAKRFCPELDQQTLLFKPETPEVYANRVYLANPEEFGPVMP